jgi:hypothetical protein
MHPRMTDMPFRREEEEESLGFLFQARLAARSGSGRIMRGEMEGESGGSRWWMREKGGVLWVGD